MIRLILIFLAISGTAMAQNADVFREKLLVADSLTGAKVKVNLEGDSAERLQEVVGDKQASETKVRVYRVNIFFDNSQSARVGAQSAKEKFEELFEGIPSYLSYENPYFKLTVGNFVTSEEAITMLGKLQEEFPKCFLSRETVSVSVLLD